MSQVADRRAKKAAKSQIGSALFVVIVLLALLALIGFFATQVSLSEQKTSRSDVRAKAVLRVAEAGVNHAIEYVDAQRYTIIPRPLTDAIDPDDDPDTLNSVPFANVWQACTAADTDFPCGAAAPAYRTQMYRYIGGAGTTDLQKRTLPLTSVVNDPNGAPPAGQSFAAVDGFTSTYRVGALLCPIDSTTGAVGCVAPESAETHVVVLVSQGQMAGEQAGATITETVGFYRKINSPPNIPPITSSGIIEGLGNATVVPNPNSGGPGVPVSVWTRRDFELGGSEQTCQADEYYRSGTPEYESGVVICDDCDCESGEEVSTKKLGERFDVLDRNNADGGETVAPSPYPFPCDLFEFTFGLAAREDLKPESADGIPSPAAPGVPTPPPPAFCETQIMVPFPMGSYPGDEYDMDGDGTADYPDASGKWPQVVEYLEANAKKVRPGGDFTSCDQLVHTSAANYNPAVEGLIWAPGGCSFSGNSGTPRVGTPEAPVFLVSDKSFNIKGPELFGIVFVRDPAFEADSTTGGSAVYAPGGGNGTVYGGVVIEGPGKINGGLHVVSNPTILSRLVESRSNNPVGRVPGSWSDLLSY